VDEINKKFVEWLRTAVPGSKITYYSGSAIAASNRGCIVQGILWMAYESGYVNLLQRKSGAGDFTRFDYIAQRTRKQYNGKRP
jgi:hypothetical protein